MSSTSLASPADLLHRASMPGAFRSKGALPQWTALAFIVCAFLTRILIPQGWMPVKTAEGWRITICTGMGPMQMETPSAMAAMKGSHHRSDDQDHGASHQVCAFTAVAMALDEPSPPTLDLPRILADESWIGALAGIVAIGRGLAAPPPPSTGPPSIF